MDTKIKNIIRNRLDDVSEEQLNKAVDKFMERLSTAIKDISFNTFYNIVPNQAILDDIVYDLHDLFGVD